jgi:hypothetical protein
MSEWIRINKSFSSLRRKETITRLIEKAKFDDAMKISYRWVESVVIDEKSKDISRSFEARSNEPSTSNGVG